LIRLKVALLVPATAAQMVLFSSMGTLTCALGNGSGAGISVHGFDTCQDPSVAAARRRTLEGDQQRHPSGRVVSPQMSG
jgi:hypothetical protein